VTAWPPATTWPPPPYTQAQNNWPHWATSVLLSADSFNRANTTVNTGTTDGTGSLDPLTWTNQSGTGGINGNAAYSSGGAGITTVNLLSGDVTVSISIAVMAGAVQAGLVFRCSDGSNYWVLYIAPGMNNFTMYKVVATVFTQVGLAHTCAVNDVLKVTCSGSNIQVFQNDTLRENQTDSFNSTATKHGMYFGDSIFRLDNFSATAP
jgi:hypothetical protein